MTINMRHIWLENQTLNYRTDHTIPVVADGQALLRIDLAGICGTDIQLLNGYKDFCGIPGHEFVAHVVSAPQQPDWVGQRVVADINIPCGQCDYCRQQQPHHCRQRQVAGIKQHAGAFAEYLVMPISNLVAVPDDVSDQQAVFAEPLASAAHVLDDIGYNSQQKILLIGSGKLGLLIATILRAKQIDLDAVSRHRHQQQYLQTLGVHLIDSDRPASACYDIVIDASGTASGFTLALAAVRARGKIILKSTTSTAFTVDTSKLVVDEISIVGSRCGDMPTAINLLQQYQLDTHVFIEHIYPLAAADKAFAHATRRGAGKILLDPTME